MHQRLLKLLSFIFISSRLCAISDEVLENLVFQSDYIALVRIADVSVDSLSYFVHDLGSNHYSANFETIEVFKQSVAEPGNSYDFVYFGYDKPGKDQYRQAELCYLFLSAGLPKLLQGREILDDQYLSFSRLNLLNGGLIPANELSERRLKRFTEPSAFAKHAMKGHTRAMKNAAKSFVSQRNKRNVLVKNRVESVSDWLLEFQGIDGVMADSCVAHILIWPGWSNHFFWVNTPEGLKEYDLRITHGRPTRFRMPAFYRNWWKVDYIKESPGARESVIQHCKEERLNEKIDTYNNLIQLRMDEGRLTWSVKDAPLHLDCADDLIRIKLMLVNYSDSAMFIRWPGKQNHGESLFRFSLYYPESRTEIPVHFNRPEITQNNDNGPEERLLAAGDTVSAWFSLNDPFGLEGSYYSAFSYEAAKSGNDSLALLKVVYKPYPEEVKDSLCWYPSFDSLNIYSGYRYKTRPVQYDSVQVTGKLVQGRFECVNSYNQPGFCEGIIELAEAYPVMNLNEGETIAFKIPLSNALLSGIEFRPPFPFEIMKVGDEISVWLLNSKQGGKIQFREQLIPLFPACHRYNAVEIIDINDD